jgi:thiopeptide-type bacteriocin biosynthesis protein
MSRWISIHVFYGREQRTLLLECFAPSLAEFSKEGAIERYFFVRYWEGGPHIRLRVVPSAGAEEHVKAVLEARLHTFLLEKPVFFAMPEGSQVWARRSFVLEYGEEELYRKYGPEGIIPSYPENTFHYINYEPEYERYGGTEGMEVGERHFHIASQMVLDRLTWDNIHIKGVRLAQAITIMLGICLAFLETEQAVATFLREYAMSWHIRFFSGKPGGLTAAFMPRAELALPKLSGRILNAARDFQTGSLHVITKQDAEWAAHARTLKTELMMLIQKDRITMAKEFVDVRWGDTPMARLVTLLFSYVHMTNNRLGIALTDEISMAYLVYRSLAPEVTYASLGRNADVA